ncbi:hypothetical protein C1645_825860 [Glomus cerebriforme]|uniref:Uncharacterized protein n=1 Tax=Glomus cerebriforme TaxID=658196 RepID=A0A397SV01_9GLOM|nr:hypothetical protein C1645_825860 [Glomus cerebriforme]
MTNSPPDNRSPQDWTSNEIIGFLVSDKAFFRLTLDRLIRFFGLEYNSAEGIMDLVEQKNPNLLALSTQIQKLSNTLQTLLSVRIPEVRKTKIIPQGKELHELCKMGVLRVGDELRFIKKYITFGGIVINRRFEVMEVNKNTWASTIKEND